MSTMRSGCADLHGSEEVILGGVKRLPSGGTVVSCHRGVGGGERKGGGEKSATMARHNSQWRCGGGVWDERR